MRFIQLLVLSCAALAQQAPIGIVRGEFVKSNSASGEGELVVRTSEGGERQCAFDRKTYFEADNQLVTASALRPGDRLEIVADRKPGSVDCYARTVHVMDAASARPGPGGRPRLRQSSSPTESFAPRGELMFYGLVVRVDHAVLPLRTRTDGVKTILLRQDTRYIGDGQRVDAAALRNHTRVFIRAGRNLDNDIEAYQVVWGEIVRAP